MTATGYDLVAEDFIAMWDEKNSFAVMLSFLLIYQSWELPTAASSDQLFTDVLTEWVRKDCDALQSYRHRVRKAPNMLGRELPSIVNALKPRCDCAFPTLNIMLAGNRDYLFVPRDYIQSIGRLYHEEAPGITFTRFINDMERHQGNGSEIYAQEVSRIAKVHALNRVANIMPQQFHIGWGGMLQPGQSIEAMKLAERRDVWRRAFGDLTMADLLAEAGLA